MQQQQHLIANRPTMTITTITMDKQVQFHLEDEVIAVPPFDDESLWYSRDYFEEQKNLKNHLLHNSAHSCSNAEHHDSNELLEHHGFCPVEGAACASRLNRDMGIKSVLLQQDLQRICGTYDPSLITQSYSKISRLSLVSACLRARNLEMQLSSPDADSGKLPALRHSLGSKASKQGKDRSPCRSSATTTVPRESCYF